MEEKEEGEEKEETRIWFMAYVDDYTIPEAQKFLDSCEAAKIQELAAIGFVEKVRREMMKNPSGRLTAREIRNIASKGVFDIEFTPEAWESWLEMAVKFGVFEKMTETQDGDSFTFYTNSSVREARERIAKRSEINSKAGKISAEKKKLKQQKKDERNARRRARYRETQNQKKSEEAG